jgi:hypothetical protein
VAATNDIVKNYGSYGILIHWPSLLVQDNTVYAGSSTGGSIGIVIGGSQRKSTIQCNIVSNSAKYESHGKEICRT